MLGIYHNYRGYVLPVIFKEGINFHIKIMLITLSHDINHEVVWEYIAIKTRQVY